MVGGWWCVWGWGLVGGWVGGWMGGWMSGWVDGWVAVSGGGGGLCVCGRGWGRVTNSKKFAA